MTTLLVSGSLWCEVTRSCELLLPRQLSAASSPPYLTSNPSCLSRGTRYLPVFWSCGGQGKERIVVVFVCLSSTCSRKAGCRTTIKALVERLRTGSRNRTYRGEKQRRSRELHVCRVFLKLPISPPNPFHSLHFSPFFRAFAIFNFPTDKPLIIKSNRFFFVCVFFQPAASPIAR